MSRRSPGGGGLGAGIALLAVGVLLLLHNLGVADFRDVVRAAALSVRDLWPLFFVVWGLGLVAQGLRSRRPEPAGGTPVSGEGQP